MLSQQYSESLSSARIMCSRAGDLREQKDGRAITSDSACLRCRKTEDVQGAEHANHLALYSSETACGPTEMTVTYA
jgi:hypothetical protein